MIDRSTDQGKHADERLQREKIVWLTTVSSAGQPQSSPVWFVWDGTTFLIYSATSQKLRNIRRNPRVSLNLNADEYGGEVLTIEGTAVIVVDAPPASDVPMHMAKYREQIDGIDMTPERYFTEYTVQIKITPTRIRIY